MALKSVEVLCLNGRREKIKYNPSTTVLQILEQVCTKHNYDASFHGLKHSSKPLDVASMMKYTNLPNLAKLEIYALDSPRKASPVVVALQLEDGQRLQETFPVDTLLLDLLKFWHSREDRNIDVGVALQETHTPVCSFMNHEISGKAALANTTLQQIGLVQGRGIVRLMVKQLHDCETSPSAPATVKADRSVTSNGTTTNSTVEQRPKSNPQSAPSAPCVTHDEHHTSTQHHVGNRAETSGEPTIGFEWDGSAAAVSSIPARAEKRRKVDHDTMAVECSQRQPFADFKFPDRKVDGEPDQSIPAVDPEQMRIEVVLSMACDRHTSIYSLDERRTPSVASAEPNDNFFDHTVEDVRQRLQDLKQSRKEIDESPLMTKTMRQTKDTKPSLHEDCKAVLRVHLPNRVVLQGIFRPLEEVSAVYEFVRSNLKDDSLDFVLFTSPPKVLLTKRTATLTEYNLYPASNVHFLPLTPCDSSPLKEDAEIPKTFDIAEAISREVFLSSTPRWAASAAGTSHRNNDPLTRPPSGNTTASSVRSGDASAKGKKPMPKWLRLAK